MPEHDHGIGDTYPLSILQTGLLYDDLTTQPGAARPNLIQQIDRYIGHTDIGALVSGYEALVRRHSILRTGFAWDGDEPCQFVVASASLPITRLDWSVSVPEDRREAEIAAIVAEDRRTPFDMARAPLARLTVIRLSENEVLTLFSIHHILEDDWSSAILEAEFDELYSAAVQGRTPDLREAAPFGDFIRWQLEKRKALDDKKLSFWEEYLADLATADPIGLDGARSEATFVRASTLISPDRWAQLEKFARSARVSVPAVLYGAWALVVAGLTGSDDVVFGFTAVARPREVAHVKSLVGPCISTLPLRLRVDPSQQLRSWLRGVMGNLIDLWDDEELALVDTGTLSHRESGARNHIESILVMEKTIPRAKEHVLPGTVKTRVDSIEWTGYPVTIFAEFVDGLELNVTLDGTRGDAAAAQRLVERLKHVLLQFTDPSTPVGDLEVLTGREREELLGWGTGPAAELGGAGLAARFEEQARKVPDAVAVETADGPVSYAELNTAANRLARLLAARGAGPETFVAVAMERSADLIVAFLAVIKAGAAYVPVPAGYPLALARDVLSEISPVVLLTDQALHAAEVPAGLAAAGLPALTIGDPALTLPEDGGDLGLACGLEQVAYVMFTSGSTGAPKGVAITQANILTLTQDACWGNGNHRRVLMYSPHSFDAATYEMWVPLLAGGTVVLLPPGPLDPARLTRALTTSHITGMYLTKALFDLLVAEFPGALARLREIWTGGEEASAYSVNRAAELCPGLSVINVYGPTETTVFATYHTTGPQAPYPGPVSVGVPMDNTRVYILDASLRLAAPGVTGELYIAGPRLARGYHHRPAATATRFIPDPYGPPGTRMYRTGDLARWDHAGRIEFAGRTDDQVKIRGFRIELGAIEAALTAHPAIAGAAVAVREDRPGDKRLAAYLVPAPGTEPDHAAIARYLADQLPAFMLPAAYVTLPELPLTAHHKVDRKALPAPAAGPAGHGDLPATATEELLAGLYAEILGLPAAPGTSQDFFALGGHSLLAMRLINQIRVIFTTDLTIRDLFDHPAITALAACIDTSTRTPARIEPAPRPAIIPLSPAQSRLYVLDYLDGPNAVYNVPLALALAGPLDTGALHAAVNDLITRHETLRTCYPDHDGEPCQHILAPGPAAIALPLTQATEQDLPGLLRQAAAEPFTLAAAGPIRARLFHLAPASHVLLLVIHHIATDGWSIRPLTRDLATAYHARTRGTAPPWTPLPVQYADYALWQHASAPARGTDLDFWTRELDGLPEETPLPLDRPRPATRTHHGATVTFTIPPATHTALHHLARTSHATLFITLHTAVAALLHHHGAGTDIPLGTPAAGRTDPALDDLVGFFVNTLVLRTDLTGNPTFRQLLDRTRASDLRAYAHQDLPFDYLVDHLAPARTPARHPLFQVMLIVNQTDPAPPTFAGLAAQTLVVSDDTAKFDLAITFEPRHHPDGTPAGITANITYATDIFTPPTITALAAHLTTLLTHATRNPDTPISDLEGAGL